MAWHARTVRTSAPRLEPLLKVREVAEALSVAPGTVRKWIRCGHVHAVWLPGGELRIPQAEVQRLYRPRT